MVVYAENNMKRANTLCVRMQHMLILKPNGTHNCQCTLIG
jgi:hypothetical protein